MESEGAPPPAISVIVAARDAEATIGATLEALAGQDVEEPYEVVVVDDASRDGTGAIAAAAKGPVRVLRRDRAEGPGPARNAGVTASSARLLAFTDADCVPRADWLRRGLQALAGADLVQGAVRPVAGVERRPFDRTIWVDREYGLYETANLFVTRAAFEHVGGFEDWLEARIGKPLAEDVWLGWRIRRSGAPTVFADEAVVEHAVFRRGAGEFVGERVRLFYFPALVAKIPELRTTFLDRRLYLNRRTRELDLALAGAAGAAALARAGRRGLTLAALAAAVPYARTAYSSARRWGRREAARVLAAEVAADLVGLGALFAGSVRARDPVL